MQAADRPAEHSSHGAFAKRHRGMSTIRRSNPLRAAGHARDQYHHGSNQENEFLSSKVRKTSLQYNTPLERKSEGSIA